MKIESLDLLKNFREYRYFWLSNLLSNYAVWMQVTVVGICMSELTNSAFLIAMTQFFATFSVVIVSLPFALIVDSFRHYKFMFLVQMVMCLNALFLCIFIKIIPSPFVLLLFTFILGMTSAVRMPIGQSAITLTVPAEKIKLAAILNGWGFNLARTVGPAMAGFLFVYTSAVVAFFFIALVLGLSSIYFYFKACDERLMVSPISRVILKERAFLIVKDIRENSIFRQMSVDSFFFFLLSTSVWAFLPFYAEYQLHVSAKTQSIMISMMGVGAILSGLIMPNLRKRLSTATLQVLLTFLAGASILGFGFTKNSMIAEILFIFFGFSWASAVPLFNGEIQACASKESRGRLVAVYFFIMYLGLAVGNYLSAVGLSILSFCHFCLIVAALFLFKMCVNIKNLRNAAVKMP